MEFETAKVLFAVGLILELVGGFAVGADGGLVALLGLVLSLVGIYYLSKHFGRPDVFRNYLYSFIAALVGALVLFGFVVAYFFSLAKLVLPPFDFLSILLAFLPIWIVLWVVVVFSAYFLRRAYMGLAEAGGVGHFKTAATLVWIGALTFVILVGLVISLIGQIFAIIGAFELKQPTAAPAQTPTPQPV